MKIYAMRHGLTELNKKAIINGQLDEPLCKEGIDQANSVVPLLPESIKHIYSSTLLRAKQTADIINSRFNAPISLHDELREISFGSLAGQAWNLIENGSLLKEVHRAVKYDYRPYGGESADDVKSRVLDFLKEIYRKHDDDEVLVITHGGIIRMIHLLESELPLNEIENVSLHGFDLSKIISE